MTLHETPVEQVENKFVITKERAYFVPCVDRANTPKFSEMLGEIFNLDNPEVVKEVDEKLSVGEIILGYFNPSTKELDIHLPLEINDHTQKRIEEVFGA